MDNESLIDSYFEGTLTPQEKLLFDQKMKTNESFSEAFNFEKKTKAAITLESRRKLKEKLQKLEGKAKGKSSMSWIYIAASVVVLLGISLFFINQTPSNDKLYATYFEPFPNTESPIVRGSTQKDIKNDAFAAYEQGNYKSAVQFFHNLTETTQEEYVPFYNAISLMMLDDIEAAATIFEKIQWSSDYQGKVNWYLSLCHIKQHKPEKAKALLRDVVENQSYNHEKAKKLLRKLE